MLSLTPALTMPDSPTPNDCGCHNDSDSTAIYVDDDRQQCPNAQFTSIQAAVAAALPFSTIYVMSRYL
jgi:hypothetical protein